MTRPALLLLLAALASPASAVLDDAFIPSAPVLDVTLNIREIRKDHDGMEKMRREEHARAQAEAKARAAAAQNNPEVQCLLGARKRGMPVADAVKLCGQPAKTEPTPVSCYDAARAGNVEYNEAIRLCRGNANSDAPARCYAKARDHNASYLDAVCLCEAAVDESPADCWYRARLSNVANADAVKLCKP